MPINAEKKTLLISDLHLCEQYPEIFILFKDFIEQIDSNVDALYILGDFFESWIGDDHRAPFNTSVINLLKSLKEKNIPLYFMHGNRDFLIGNHFLSQVSATFLPDPIKINLYGTNVLLMHGDSLCIDDHAYQRVRKILRNRIVQFLFLRLPLCIRKIIAHKMRMKSKKHTANALTYIMDVSQKEVIKVMQQHDVKHLIHGHTHKPAIHSFSINNIAYERIVLGSWHDKASVLIYFSNGERRLIS